MRCTHGWHAAVPLARSLCKAYLLIILLEAVGKACSLPSRPAIWTATLVHDQNAPFLCGAINFKGRVSNPGLFFVLPRLCHAKYALRPQINAIFPFQKNRFKRGIWRF